MVATRCGMNGAEHSPRYLPCSGGSIARKKAVLTACGPHSSFSREMPLRLENRRQSRSAAFTSWYRDRAQKSRSSSRYTGAWARSHAKTGYGSSCSR